MHICTFKAQTHTTAQALWTLWTQSKHWPAWDTNLQEVTLDGAFKQGGTGTLVYQDGTRRTFTVIKLQVLESLVICISYARGTEVLVKRDLRQEGEVLHFEQDVTLSGTFLTKMMMGGHREILRDAARQQMQRTLDLLEGQRKPVGESSAYASTRQVGH
ncbi:hypothetical protein [Deinococcus cellulosilyticus]|uniref:Polyketide cyclase n=1 Tax=Deinococcus cellulosilyticus (strain DSM 18568 / NBRC 106333 / KACC 11606 / 5516J-15) TaxID=1223518 RepID=A0A511N187_DEIC1|nr:hypothetical protein [Deinococcus cellulosilyticus]GEM46211.1 hypothetical protein DC3_18460 [Deinococcus cellulosilyticus NBRC 106333 = KACC 11606]